jgi:hypothetical protein
MLLRGGGSLLRNKEGGTIKHTNSLALVRELIIPTERPPLVGKVNANFWKRKGKIRIKRSVGTNKRI